ncbi:SRPBCC domain-containing protein [uncultured Corynebacterium sp.]|uniref:SRPBCC domain-containing protein n=1 Tax=uncultured Corynebacterium sp. TaxID=159447 RepID=UPI0025F2007D|nr:SRPBCC domain-containing protein [uncultured Corynebacterium sp.]
MSSQLSPRSLQELSFSIFSFISRCPEQVYEAIVDPRQLSRYFATGGARGRMDTGATVTWDFADFPGRFPVRVIEVSPSRTVIFEWEGMDTVSGDGVTRVSITFEPVDDYTRTKVTITEYGWKVTTGGSQGAFGSCMRWTGMLAALKVWLEHGVLLREDFYS